MEEIFQNLTTAYLNLCRQPGQGISKPQPQALAGVIKALFRKDGNDFLIKARQTLLSEANAAAAQRRAASPGELRGETFGRQERLARRQRLPIETTLGRSQDPIGAAARRAARNERRGVGGNAVAVGGDVSTFAEWGNEGEDISSEFALVAADRLTTVELSEIEPGTSGRAIVKKFGAERIRATLLANGVSSSEIENKTDNQLGNMLKSKQWFEWQ